MSSALIKKRLAIALYMNIPLAVTFINIYIIINMLPLLMSLWMGLVVAKLMLWLSDRFSYNMT